MSPPRVQPWERRHGCGELFGTLTVDGGNARLVQIPAIGSVSFVGDSGHNLLILCCGDDDPRPTPIPSPPGRGTAMWARGRIKREDANATVPPTAVPATTSSRPLHGVPVVTSASQTIRPVNLVVWDCVGPARFGDCSTNFCKFKKLISPTRGISLNALKAAPPILNENSMKINPRQQGD